MEIKIKDLKALCENILKKIEKSGLKEIEIDHDYYWDICYDDIYNFKVEKPELVIGSFVDDWESLKKCLDDEYPLITIIDFARLGNIMKIIAHSIFPSNTNDQSSTKTWSMTITIKDLQHLYKTILTKTENRGVEQIEIDLDFYWDIKNGEAYNFDIEYPQLVKKSFIENWSNLKKILDSQNSLTKLDVEKLGNIIKIVGDKIYKSKIFYS